MKYCEIIFVLCITLFACNDIATTGSANALKTNKVESPAEGYWQIPPKNRSYPDHGNIMMASTDVFLYEKNCVTLKLFTTKAWMWKSSDDYYKLKAKWGHDSLYYLPPFANWQYLASFDGKNFLRKGDSSLFTFYKVSPSEIDKSDSAILKKRKLHDYNIKPLDKWE
ncbi:MAG: hypothetical protein V2A54_04535 [Bacteroidota bacterium]